MLSKREAAERNLNSNRNIHRGWHFIKWKDLTLSDPPDLTKLYNFMKFESENDSWYDLDIENIEALREVGAGAKIRYIERQPEKTEVSHKDIITKWWYIKEAESWGRITAYSNNRYRISVMNIVDEYIIDIFRNKEYFQFAESSDLPPEN